MLKNPHKEKRKNRYKEARENNLGFLEYKINNRNILFEYKTRRIKNSFSNDLITYLKITEIEDDIKILCKIHFYCSEIVNRVWLEMRVGLVYESLNNLAKHSTKTVHKIISETDFISQKRAERNKNN